MLKNDEICEFPENKCDPNVVAQPNVKHFNEILGKYKKQVETATGIKTIKKTPKITKKTTSKSSKSTKSSKKQSSSELDWLQMLPLWTVKQILTSLDEKTLKKLKFNQYFTYIINDIKKDRKLHKFLNTKLSQFTELSAPQTTNIHQLTRTEKRLIKLLERGTTLKSLRSK